MRRRWNRKLNSILSILLIFFLSISIMNKLLAWRQPKVMTHKMMVEEILRNSQPPHEVKVKDPTVRFLFYNNFYNKDWVLGNGNNTFHMCGEMGRNCVASRDRTSVNVSDVVVFHGYWNFPDGEPGRDRHSDQVWVWVADESPQSTTPTLQTHFFDKPENHINLTMTTNHYSDIPRRYGKFIRQDNDFDMVKLQEAASRKYHLGVWMVDTCDTFGQREVYMEALRDLVPIDVISSNPRYKLINTTLTEGCHKRGRTKCLEMIETEYKFLFAFENSFCEEWITEQLFEAMNLNIVLVVFGGGRYRNSSSDSSESIQRYEQYLPTGSYIDAGNFNNVSELANHLTYLYENLDAYMEYFWWKRYFYVKMIRDWHYDVTLGESFCKLCRGMQDQRWRERKIKSYPNLTEWLWSKQQCFPDHYIDHYLPEKYRGRNIIRQ